MPNVSDFLNCTSEGRVGRGAEQSYCILVTNYKLTEDTRKRLEIMVRTNDGLK